MNKIKTFLVVSGVVLFVFSIFFLVLLKAEPKPYSKENSDSATSDSHLPNYLLGEQEEKQVRGLTETFAVLYYSYTSDDHRNLTSTGDYQAPEFQETTLKRVEELEKNYIPGQVVRTEIDPESFAYTYQKSNQVEVRYNGTTTEKSDVGQRTYKIALTLVLEKRQNRWLVVSSSIQNK